MTKIINKKKGKPKKITAKRLTRKEVRKQKHVQKKQNKRIFFSSKEHGKEMVAAAAAAAKQAENSNTRKTKQRKKKTKKVAAPLELDPEQLLRGEVDSEDDESIDSDFSDNEVDALMPSREKKSKKVATKQESQKQKSVVNDATAVRRRELQHKKELEHAARKQRVKQLKRDNEEEDIMIARLEKKLKLNKTKDKNRLVRKMFNDGLDYALELCLDDEEERQKRELKEKRKQEQQNAEWSDEDDEGEGFNDDLDIEDEADDFDGKNSSDDEDNSFPSEAESDNDNSDNESGNSNDEQEDEFKEDIYGRKRDKDGIVIASTSTTASSTGTQKYIPPHQRALLAAQGDDKQAQILERLRKNCKGLLNRLSEANLHKIATGIEEFYMKNSRHNMNETLTRLLNEVLVGKALANERMVQEHMVLLAYLHAQIGTEIGAHFLQSFIEQFEKFVQDIKTLAVEDKHLNNLVLILAYMYIFKIYEHNLLLEIINRLADNLCEKSIECMLLIFQSVGFKLRKDDPLAFKQMMQSVQKKIGEAPLEMKENLRLKFMVDILNAVKNNNINKLPQFDPELAENLRKRLKAMLRNDKYVITLNITMADLLRADQVGKWWVVGSAWSGNINDLGAAAKSDKNAVGAKNERFSEKLLSLAKQQKMNTDERRNIFCIIMSAEDYVDAFEKILHLSLKDQRAIAYVILQCCLNEKRSNPYYAHLALKFCNFNRKFQLAFQFASWDRINEVESLQRQQIKNLAKFLEYLILSGGLSLAVLKVVNFLQLDKLSFLFMKEIMVGLLLAASETEVYQAFERVAKNTKLQQFKNSIRLFMQHFLLQQTGVKLKLDEEQMVLLEKRIDYADKILAYVDL